MNYNSELQTLLGVEGRDVACKKESLLRALEKKAAGMRMEAQVVATTERVLEVLEEFCQNDGVETLAVMIAKSAPESGAVVLDGMLRNEGVPEGRIPQLVQTALGIES